MEWKQISSAPKDGTKIIAFIEWVWTWPENEKGSQIDVICWDENAKFWVAPTPPNYVQGIYEDDCRPTHWMPLPKKPVEQKP